MMKCLYIGLLRHDGTEPPRETGYRRISVPGAKLPDVLPGRQIVFPDVTAPGYGVIAKAAAYVDESAPMHLAAWDLPMAVDVHEGVVPVIHNGTLYRGVEVQATVELSSTDICGTGG